MAILLGKGKERQREKGSQGLKNKLLTPWSSVAIVHEREVGVWAFHPAYRRSNREWWGRRPSQRRPVAGL